MIRIANFRAALVALTLLSACAAQKPAPVDDRRAPPQAAASQPLPRPVAGAEAAPPAPAFYVVKRGDTLYSIALEHGLDYREVARWNKLDDPTRIRIGQQLRLAAPEMAAQPVTGAQVGAARVPGAIEARPLEPSPAGKPAPIPEGVRTAPQALRLPYSEQNLAALSRVEGAPAVKPEPGKPAAPVAPEREPGAPEFTWPAKGKVVAPFSEPRNKGIDIAGNIGDPVVAAAAGRVIYVGSGIPGLGKFVVVRHENGFNTVYAHNKEVVAKMDQNVARGQKIAELGGPETETPRLHFQIRRQGTPLDPLRYLPSP